MAEENWKTIAASIAARIKSGEFEPGSRLASGDQLAKELGVNRNATHRAIDELQRQGLVVRRQGSGTVVADHRKSKSRRIALIVDGYSAFHNFPSGDLLRGIQDKIGEESSLVIADSKHDPDLENRQLKKVAREADGILLYATGLSKPSPVLTGLLSDGYPVVALDRIPKAVEMDAVLTDNRAAAIQAVKALVDRGHTRIGFIGLDKHQYNSVGERFQGYQEAMESAGLSDHAELVRWLPDGSDRSTQIYNQLVRDTLFALRNGEQPITALFCTEDLVGCAVVAACERLGISLPHELEIITFNDWHPMTLRTPWNVHRLIQRKFDIGVAAAGLLLDRIASPSQSYRVIRIDADFALADAGLQEFLLSTTL